MSDKALYSHDLGRIVCVPVDNGTGVAISLGPEIQSFWASAHTGRVNPTATDPADAAGACCCAGFFRTAGRLLIDSVRCPLGIGKPFLLIRFADSWRGERHVPTISAHRLQ
jgi:hypothetical protein